jgi:hypothetical protein
VPDMHWCESWHNAERRDFTADMCIKAELSKSFQTENNTRLDQLAYKFWTIFIMGLSNMCNIAHVKGTKNNNFLLKNSNHLLLNYIFNIKCTSSNTNVLF